MPSFIASMLQSLGRATPASQRNARGERSHCGSLKMPAVGRTGITRTLAFAVLLSFTASGCGGKGSTKLSYSTPILPFGISFSMSENGWAVAGGLATPVGTFGIERSFESRDEFTYIVLRDRTRGTDQVFKAGATGHVDVHPIGEHKLRMQREGNRWIIETESISGTLNVQVYPSNAAIARADFGTDYPDIVVTTDRKLIVESASMFTANRTIPIDTIESLALIEPYGGGKKWLWANWKKGAESEPLFLLLPNSPDVESNFTMLSTAITSIAPYTACIRKVVYYNIGITILMCLMFIRLTYVLDNKQHPVFTRISYEFLQFSVFSWAIVWAGLVLYFTPAFWAIVLNVIGFVASIGIGLVLAAQRSGK